MQNNLQHCQNIMNEQYQLYYYKNLVSVNNAAHTILGAAEELSSEEIQAQFKTNVFGVFKIIGRLSL